MCGPIALSARARVGARATLPYFVGRLVSYTLLGALAGGLGRVLLASAWARWAEALLSWTLAATLLWTAKNSLWPRARGGFVRLGTGPRRSLQRTIGGALAYVANDPLLLGVGTALLPCGVLFSALLAAATLGKASLGALALSVFALLTGGAVIGVAQLGGLRIERPWARRLLASVLVAGALILLYRPWPTLLGTPACHAAAQHGAL